MVSMSVSPLEPNQDAAPASDSSKTSFRICVIVYGYHVACRPTPPPLRQLQYAVAVADARSFRRAAEQCGVSQPSLSAQLAQLEDALGRAPVRARPPARAARRRPARTDRHARAACSSTPTTSSTRPGGWAIRWPARCASASSRPSRPTCCRRRRPRIRRAHPRLTVRWVEDKTETLARDLARRRARRRAAGARGGPRRSVAARGDRPRSVRAGGAARHPLGEGRRPGEPRRAARRAPAAARRRPLPARSGAGGVLPARAPRSSRSAPPACRRWRRWCRPAPA